MQTFLPYDDFDKSAQSLDMRRLGKQRVETLQILQALTSNSKWITHPASQMWKGYTSCLVEYGVAICKEWIKRGYKDTCLQKIEHYNEHKSIKPAWLGLEIFHSKHRGILLDKNYEWYRQFNWTEGKISKINDSYPYYWPTKHKVTI